MAVSHLAIGRDRTLLARSIGTLCAIGLWRVSSRSAEVIRSVSLLPLAVPPIIAAMAFSRLYMPLGLIDAYLGLILAHTVLSAPLVFLPRSPGLIRVWNKPRAIWGPSNWVTLRRVIIPGIKPGILAGVVFAFILS